MEIDKMSHAERLALLRELAAITHVCAIDGCDNEARHRCEVHPVGEWDYGADVCDEHWAGGVGGRCWDCRPVEGPKSRLTSALDDMCMRAMSEHLASLIDAKCKTITMRDNRAAGTITVRRPERFRRE